MISITISAPQLEEIRQAFKQAPLKLTMGIGKAINRIIVKVEGDAKRLAPVNKRSGGGTLRQSIRSGMTGIASGRVEVGAKYGVFVHEGTRPHIIRIRFKRVLADKRSGQIFGTVVNHPGTRANPFLQKAVDNNKGFIEQEFREVLKSII